ncbi:MAG: glycosyltransferase family 1 protein [Caldilineales bacterium]
MSHLVVNGWFWDQLNTGSGQYLRGLADHLPAIAPQHRFTLVMPSRVPDTLPAGWQGEVAPPAARLAGDNVAKLWFEQVTYPRACRRLAADIAFTPYWGSSWRRPCRTAVTVHDLIPLLLPAYRGGALQRAYTSLVGQTARRADVVLTDSEASRRDIVDHLGAAPARVHAVLLAVDERFRPVYDPVELDRVRSKYSLPDRFVLYLGGFDVRKNVPRLVRAFAELPTFGKVGNSDNLFLVIAGKLPAADTPFTPDPRRVAAETGIADRVRFTGWVDEVDKPALYSLASLFVFPSLYEGFGLPIAEAAACGTPVLTSNRSSLPEAAPNALLVDPEDVSAIAAGITAGLSLSPNSASPVPRTWQDVAEETARLLFEFDR